MLDTLYFKYYGNIVKNIQKINILDLIEPCRKVNLYGIGLYRIAKIDVDYFGKIIESDDVLSEIIEREHSNLRWILRLLGLLPYKKKYIDYVDLIVDKSLSIGDPVEVAFILMEILKIPWISRLLGHLSEDIFDSIYSLAYSESIGDIFLILSVIALSDQRFISLRDITDQTLKILSRAPLEHIGLLFSGICQYSSREFIGLLARYAKKIIMERFRQAHAIEKLFFRRRIQMLLPRNDILHMSLCPIFEIY